jgi:hypothetical protein
MTLILLSLTCGLRLKVLMGNALRSPPETERLRPLWVTEGLRSCRAGASREPLKRFGPSSCPTDCRSLPRPHVGQAIVLPARVSPSFSSSSSSSSSESCAASSTYCIIFSVGRVIFTAMT